MKDRKTLLIVAAVGIGTFMSALDSSVVNLALPLIKNQFGVTMSIVEWIVTAYLLVVSSLLLTYGRLSDLYGQKRFYLTGFIIFVIGSALCGLSSNIGMLVAFRVVQALGAGMLFSTGPAIITNAVPPENRGRALSAVAVAVALGLSSGPVIGGLLATYVGWPSIFYINVPIGIAGIVMVLRFVPDIAKKTEKVRFDVPGSILVFAGLFLLLLPLSISGDNKSPVLFFPLLVAGLLLIAVFIVFELRQKNPMLNVRLFQNRVFAASNAAALLVYIAQFILIFLLQFYLQTLRGFPASYAGLLYLPMPLASLCVAPLAGILSDKVDSRFISSSGALVMACGLFLLSFLNTATPIAFIVISLAVTGLGFGLFNTPNNSAIMGNVPPQNRGTASGTLATMRNIGMALGVAISGALFSMWSSSATAALTAAGQTGAELTAHAFVSALHLTYLAAAAIATLATIASLIKGRVMTEKEKAQTGAGM
jgi:EmrB/QacA subfamily drug resistance transporter